MKNLILTAALCVMASGVALAQDVPGAHFIENWDMNQDGVVSLEDAMEKRSDVFVMFDSDENGALSADEYKSFDATRAEDMKQNAGGGGHGKGPMKRAQAGLTLEFNDVDKDGQVTKEEFVGRTKDWMVMLDRNGDGNVSKKDFGPRP